MNYNSTIDFIRNRRKNELIEADRAFINALRSHSDLNKIEKDLQSLRSEKRHGKSVDENEIARLADEKNKYLKRLGIDFEPSPHCQKCGDSGRIDGKICSCVVQMVAGESEYKSSFEQHDLSVFSENDKAKVADVYNKMKAFCEIFPTKNKLNVLFFGMPGTGKTFLAGCVANEINKRGYSVIFTSAFGFTQDMLCFHTAAHGEKMQYLAPMLDCDLLIIDDLGTESLLKNVTVEYFYNVLNERMRLGRHTLITTNLDDKLFSDRYGERVTSRLFDSRTSMRFLLSSIDLRR